MLLIEEPERGLHASSQRALVYAALEHAEEEGKQLFWATHSTVMAPLLNNCSVHLVTLPEGEHGTTTTSAGQEQADAIRDALGHWNLDLFGYDVVVLMDGETETAALPEVVEHILGPRLAAAVRLEPLGGDLKSKQDLATRMIGLLLANRTKVFVFVDDDDGAKQAAREIETQFGSVGFTSQNVHFWNRGVGGEPGEQRGAEFEDNFSHEELVTAANQLGGASEITVKALNKRAQESRPIKISKVLGTCYQEAYGDGMSKPRLGRNLGAIALARIKADEPRGRRETTYEFEDAIAKIRGALDPRQHGSPIDTTQEN